MTPIPQFQAPAYVHDLVDLLLGGGKLEFHRHAVPADVRWRLIKRCGRPAPGVVSAALTVREMQVLVGMANGKSNLEIGKDLQLAEDTIKTHARRLYRKLGARDRAHAVATGFRAGLIG